MKVLLALARKDLRILARVRAAWFFTFVWPLIVAVLFGFVFAGQNAAAPRAALRVAVVDEDNTDGSRAFIARMQSSGLFDVSAATREDAERTVRRGARTAFIALKSGFGESSERPFSSGPRRFELGVDPSRGAEAAMLEGVLTKLAMEDLSSLFTERAGTGDRQWQPLEISQTAVARQRRGPPNAFAITFAQGAVWGIIGCVMTFAIGLVSERVRGTFVRLGMAPISRAQILGGKALACFASIMLVETILFLIARFVFDVRPASPLLLLVAGLSAAAAFVGFMMLIAGLGRTEQAVSGAGWAMLMPMAMFGGAMIPQFVMPGWMITAGNLSPIKWAIVAFEGAVWRGLSPGELALPCGILLAFGAVCFAIGVRGLKE